MQSGGGGYETRSSARKRDVRSIPPPPPTTHTHRCHTLSQSTPSVLNPCARWHIDEHGHTSRFGPDQGHVYEVRAAAGGGKEA